MTGRIVSNKDEFESFKVAVVNANSEIDSQIQSLITKVKSMESVSGTQTALVASFDSLKKTVDAKLEIALNIARQAAGIAEEFNQKDSETANRIKGI